MNTFPGQDDMRGSEGYIDMECFLFTLSLIWSIDGNIDGIKLNRFDITFINEGADLENDQQEAINHLSGTSIDLDEDLLVPEDQSLRKLAEAENLFLVPLFATVYFFQALVVARLEHEHGIYRRMGVIEVALRFQAGESAPGTTKQEAMELPWSVDKDATYLIYYMEKSPRQLGETGDYHRIRIV